MKTALWKQVDVAKTAVDLQEYDSGSNGTATVVLGRYRLIERIGSGGFGTVWKASDLKLKRLVAVKEVKTATTDRQRRRVQQEATAAARLTHPNIVALYEYASEGDTTYLISELVEGSTLDRLSQEGRLSDHSIAEIGIQIASALEAAHKAGVIHRDVKPQNIAVNCLWEPEFEEETLGPAKLMDFGVAHIASGDQLTATGDVIGTLAYMAPEQASGQPVTEAADSYSLALTLYEAWAGTNPVRAAAPVATVGRIGSKIPSLKRYRRDLPSELTEVIDAALQPDPKRRASLEEIEEVLEEYVDQLGDQPLPAIEPSRTLFNRAPLRRLARAVNALALAAAATVAALLLDSTLAAGAIALLVAAVVTASYLLPRLAWFLIAAGAVVAAATATDGGYGLATLLLAALMPTPILLFRAPSLWALPLLAPLLGLISVAPLYLVFAMFAARSWLTRAALGCLGFWWLALAEPLLNRGLVGREPELPLQWQDSISTTLDTVLPSVLTSSTAATILGWGLLAALLPAVIPWKRFRR